MKLVIREYLASLKERDELDAVLPDLLTELGFTVYSRPTRGTRQYGVDVAAVGPGQDGIRRVHLFSVKSGDLDRNEWNTASPQSLRPSLDEILDHYIASRIPPEYARLPVAICLTFGGAIDEQVRAEVTGYMTRNTTPKISFEEWNGDRLAQVILDGILREELLPAMQRSHLRKAVAMVEEPDIALDHFQKLLRALADQPGTTPAVRLSRARLINICLWIMFVWAREAENVEAPYRASELALLEVWQLLKIDIAKTSKAGEAASLVLNELAELHFTIWDALFEDKILPAAEIRHAISTAVESHAALDINLKLFDLIGRLALRGLWLVWQLSPASGPVVLTNDYLNTLPALISDTTRATVNKIDRLIEAMMAIVSNNRALLSPIGDWQAIDIGLAFTLLACRPGAHGAIDQWAEELAKHSMFAFKAHGRYDVEVGAACFPEMLHRRRHAIKLLLPQTRARLHVVGAIEAEPGIAFGPMRRKMADLAHARAPGSVVAEIREESGKVFGTALAAQQPRDPALMVFEQHGPSLASVVCYANRTHEVRRSP